MVVYVRARCAVLPVEIFRAVGDRNQNMDSNMIMNMKRERERVCVRREGGIEKGILDVGTKPTTECGIYDFS